MRLLGFAEEPVSVAASPSDVVAAADDRTEVLPWRGGVLVTRHGRRPIPLPPEAALLPSGSGLQGVIRSSRWLRSLVVALPLLVAIVVTGIVSGLREGGAWGYARAALMSFWVYAVLDTCRTHRAARDDLRAWLARWNDA